MNILKVKREENGVFLFAIVLTMVLNALTIYHYFGDFTTLHNNYFNLFIGKFRISGFDPLTYYVVSHWEARYNVYRHPFLAFLMWFPYIINQATMWLFGINIVQFIVAAIIICCASYAFLFLYRILHEIVRTEKRDAFLLCCFLYSFAYIMLSAMVPDHFIISMFLLLLTLYISGKLMKERREMSILQGILLFFLTAGISLNNGLKVFLSGLFVNKKRFFHPAYLLMAVILPAALIWGFCRLEYHYFVLEGEKARHAIIAKKKAEKKKREAQMAVQANKTTPTVAKKKQPRQGKPIMQGEFMRWTDITTSRWESGVENLFGEAIQLHPDYLLKDTYRNRPIIVKYRWVYNYVIEAIIFLLFIFGVVCGGRSRFLWLCLSYFLLDMGLHMGLGFGINEIYIMSAHYMYVVPIAIGYALKNLAPYPKHILRISLTLLTVYLFAYNGYFLIDYLL